MSEQRKGAYRDGYIVVDGARVHLREAGSGPPLVLLHGLVGSLRNWDRNLQALAEHATVYALDLPSMGWSDRLKVTDGTLAGSADEVAACMDALGIGRAHIAGHSRGGAVAMKLAARYPERVDKLILFAPANPFCPLGEQLIRFYNSGPGRYFAHLVPHLPRSLKAISLRRMYGDAALVTDEVLSGYIDGLAAPGTIEHILSILHHWTGDMALLRSELCRLAAKPTLMIWGDRDRAVGLASAAHLRRWLPVSELVVLPGVGHIPFEESPEPCNRAVRQWLTGEDAHVA